MKRAILVAVLLIGGAAYGQQDTTAPVLLDFTISPVAFDTGQQAVVFTVCVTAEDDLSDFVANLGAFSNSSYLFFGSISFPYDNAPATLCQQFVAPAHSLYGFYYMEVNVRDGLGNEVRRACSALGRGSPYLDLDGFGPCELNNRVSGSLPDIDSDGFPDDADNCPTIANPDQADADLDLIGDVCDPFPNDRDNDQAQCEADLAQCLQGTCPVDLAQCQADLTSATSALATCTADLAGSSAALATCTTDLANSSAALTTCTTDLASSLPALATCTTDLADATATLATVEAQLAAATVDADGDGKRDVDDACAGTTAGAAIDAAGCSAAQFCTQFDATTGDGKRACKRADWRNDEPVMRAAERDCVVDRGAAGVGDDRCVAVGP